MLVSGPNLYDPFILTCDGIAIVDICIKFMTGRGQEDCSRVILQPKTIAMKYIQGMFFLDLISALPLQCIPLFADCTHPTNTIWFPLKLFKLITLRNQWKNLYMQIGLSYIAANALTVFARCVIFYHWMTYIHFQVATFFFHYYDVNNKEAQDWFRRVLVIDSNGKILQKYCANLFYVCGVCNGAGNYNPIKDIMMPELIMNSAMGLGGLVFLTYTFTALLKLAMYARFEVYLYHGRLKELSEYMVFKMLPKALQQKIHMFLSYKFYEHYFNEKAIMNTINEQIKQEINMNCCKRLVMNVPLFQDLPVALINTIVFSLTRMLYMPGEVNMIS